MRKIHCLDKGVGGSAALYFINFGTVEAPITKKRFSRDRRPAWFLRGQPSWPQASPRGRAPTALPSATRQRGMPGRLQESIHLQPGSRRLAALDECVALKSTIKPHQVNRSRLIITNCIRASHEPRSKVIRPGVTNSAHYRLKPIIPRNL